MDKDYDKDMFWEECGRCGGSAVKTQIFLIKGYHCCSSCFQSWQEEVIMRWKAAFDMAREREEPLPILSDYL